jgi:alkanesulfonate monooxygenase SsuD/methylene tetrahydromethanopterin reductase-like flavin-dependent oxidoreductase (luciferase family)
MTGVKVGIVQMPTDSWPATVDRAREIESYGYDHLWLYDHLTWRHYRDRDWHATIPWLSGLAVSTSTIRLGTMVTSPNFRHPVTLAKDAMSIDHLSNGRFILGVGSGTGGFDAVALGDAPITVGQRAGRLEEFVDTLDGLLRGELTNHKGEWFTIDEARNLPGCVQTPRLPLAVASGGPRTRRMAARTCDMWITMGDTSGPPESPEAHITELGNRMKQFVASCDELGRDPDQIDKLVFVPGATTYPTERIETFQHFAEQVAELGYTDIVVHDCRTDDEHLNFDPDVIPAIAAWAANTGK